MTFHQPSVWFLVLLLVLPLLWWRWSMERRRRAIQFSSVALAGKASGGWRAFGPRLVPVLRSAALVGLIVALARPQEVRHHNLVQTEGIAIQLVVDRSGSMEATDFQIGGKPVTRLTAVKQVISDFVGGGETLVGRPGDLIGVIAFGTFADSVCPLTLDHDHVLRSVASIEIPRLEQEQATAIGDAIALGVERIRGLDEETQAEGIEGLDAAAAAAARARHQIKGKVMILLTDGENNAGMIGLSDATDLATAFDIRVYTIGAGSVGGVRTRIDPFTGRPIRQRVPIDEDALRTIAKTTGGAYFRATDTNSLREIYARIDEMERTRIRTRRYSDAKELAVTGTRLSGVSFPPLLAVVFVLLLLEQLLATTRYRRLT